MVVHYIPRLDRCSGTAFLPNERFVNVRDDTTTSNGRFDKTVQLFVSSDGELKMPGSDTLHLEILRCVASQLQHLNMKIIKLALVCSMYHLYSIGISVPIW